MRVGKGINQEEPHASTANHRCSPPRRLPRPSNPSQLWLALPTENREHILNALSRVVAEHLAVPPTLQEVTHEQP
jgi:hypothetical protein